MRDYVGLQANLIGQKPCLLLRLRQPPPQLAWAMSGCSR